MKLSRIGGGARRQRGGEAALGQGDGGAVLGARGNAAQDTARTETRYKKDRGLLSSVADLCAPPAATDRDRTGRGGGAAGTAVGGGARQWAARGGAAAAGSGCWAV